MEETGILYLDECIKTERDYLHIYRVRVADGCICVKVFSDMKIIDLYLNGKLCCRQQGNGEFDFRLPHTEQGTLEIKIASKLDPDIVQIINVEI